MPVAKRNFLKRHGHGLIQSAKQLKREVDEVYSFVVNTPQTELSCQPCEMPPSTTSVATEQFTTVGIEKPRHHRVVSFDGSKHCELDANEQEWLDLLHQRPEIKDQSKMTEWMNTVVAAAEEQKAMIRGPPAPVLGAPLGPARFAENPHPTDTRVTDMLLLTAPVVDFGLHQVSPSIYASPSPPFPIFEIELDKFAATSEPVETTIMQAIENDAKSASDFFEFAALTDNVDISNVFD